jgi:hypothetical protein
MLTQEELISNLKYNQSTGVFCRAKVSRPCNAKHLKSEAGYLSVNGKGNVYRKISINGKVYFAHSLAWLYVYGVMPKMIDHIDGNGSNNAMCNLRLADYNINSKNKKININNKTGVTGVSMRYGKYCVNIANIYRGCFCDLELAELVANEIYLKEGFHKNHGRVNAV